jgi:CheY-like chemotaxis protein
MSETVLIEAIKTVPGILWVIFAVIAFIALRGTILAKLGQAATFKASGVEFTFAERLLDEAAAKAETGPPPSAADRRAAVSRLEHAVDILNGGRILWVDDNPDWNRPLIDLFRQLKMTVDIARSTSEALPLARSRPYDLVITDMRRDTEQPAATAGITLIDKLRDYGVQAPIIVFAAGFDPNLGVHPAIFAYTVGADGLIHYVIDIMERIRFGTLL